MSTAVIEAKLAQTLCKELKLEREVHLHSDSAAGLASVSRCGFGRLRHLDIKQLWLPGRTTSCSSHEQCGQRQRPADEAPEWPD
eukprot:1355132-Heterocapsa_arctica.AAC.1